MPNELVKADNNILSPVIYLMGLFLLYYLNTLHNGRLVQFKLGN